MSNTRRWYQAVLAALLLVFVTAAWLVFAPLQLGGHSAYTIVTGNSMEPGFHLGELVIVQPQVDYRVGDIVVYRNPQLKAYVFHRIVGTKLDRYFLKGDNNPWIDSYLPTQEEVVGKLWFHIPTLGKAVQWLRLPLHLSLMAGATGGILMTVLLTGHSRQKKSKGKQSRSEWSIMDKRSISSFMTSLSQWAPVMALREKRTRDKTPGMKGPAPLPNRKIRGWSGIIEGLFFGLGLLAFASLALVLFTFNRPVLRTVPDDIPYQQIGKFSYSAVVPPGVYDSGLVKSGEPVFPSLTCILNLQFDYYLAGSDLKGLNGSHQLSAQVLEATSGWKRTLLLEPETPFTGNTFATRSTINLCQVEQLVAAMEQKTGFRAPYYTLVFTPGVTVNGKMSGRDFQAAFEPRLVLQFDPVHFFVAWTDPLLGDPLKPSETGTLAGFRTQPNTLALLGKEFIVSNLRSVAMIGLGISLVGLLLLVSIISIVAQRNQQSRVQMKYSSMLVDIHDRTLELSSPAIDVVTMDDLAKLAERHNSLILHEPHGLIHHYLVQGDQITYRFILDESGGSLQEVLSIQQLENGLKRGIERGEFQVYYQPIVSLANGKITTVEALLRWQHPERGLISAGEFISIAERTGVIEKIGEWMLQAACTQFKRWQNAGMQISLAINLSEYQLERDPAEHISRVLQRTGVDPRTIQIEVSEANIINNISSVLPGLKRLTDLGLQLSVDNIACQFPLSAFNKLRINSIKIDRLVIEKIRNAEDASSVGAMITEGINLGLNVVGEGVETEAQLDFLRSHQCTQAQGYLLGRPAPADEVTMLLEKGGNTGNHKVIKRRLHSRDSAG
jgi:signal peptidase I